MRHYQPGDPVRVLALGKAGHVRIPHYIRTCTGTVEQYCGTYLNPEDLAIGRTDRPAVDLYRVRFSQDEIWAEDDHPAQDDLVIEIYDHWLEPVEMSDAP